jgi:peptidoglycan hydrolase-like protein with peptidoglycan-binding domain
MRLSTNLGRRAGVALLGAALLVGAPGGAWADEVVPAPVETVAPPADPAAAAPVPEAPAIALGSRVMRLGDTGADVAELQGLLKVAQTGTFDAATKKAVKQAQRRAGLKAHGRVGPRTLDAIRTGKRAAKAATSSRSMPRTGTPAANQRYARAYIAGRYGWGAGQMSCLRAMWTRESGWRHRAVNPNGIYRGIPQTSARVYGSMGYSTAAYMSSPAIQIKVGASYIRNRYGSPCAAWSFWRSHHWY